MKREEVVVDDSCVLARPAAAASSSCCEPELRMAALISISLQQSTDTRAQQHHRAGRQAGRRAAVEWCRPSGHPLLACL